MSPLPGVMEMPKGVVPVIFSNHINLATITAAADVITSFTPGFPGSIYRTWWVQGTVVSTGSKAATLNWEINTRNVTGGAIALTSALCTPLGVVIAGTEITGANTFDRDDTISLEAASVTAFSEGDGTIYAVLFYRIQ